MDIDISENGLNEKVSNQPNALEQFLVLAKGASNLAAVQLIKQVLEAPGVYVFSELLDCPNIIDLKNSEDNKNYYNLLELFAYGVYKDLKKNASLPELSDAMMTKLRHLTLVSLATGQKSLPLSDLSKHLDISSTRQLEDLIIEAIYAGIVSGRLDQKNGVLEVDYAIGRDIKPDDLQQITATLQDWCVTCDAMLGTVDAVMTDASRAKDDAIRHSLSLDQQLLNLKTSLKAQLEENAEPLSSDSSRDKSRHAESSREKLRQISKKTTTHDIARSARPSTSSKFWQKDS